MIDARPGPFARWRYFTPPSIVRNLRLNRRHVGGIDRQRLILVSPATRLDVAPTARINLAPKARFNFGFVPHPFVAKAPASLRMEEGSRLVVSGPCTMTTGAVLYVAPRTTVTIGANVYVISNTRILAYADIEIGRDCIIGWEAQIMSGDGHPAFRDERWINPPRPISIGDRVWIGARATILKGVTIGAGAVIGANAVVTHDVPENATVAGNPARLVATGVSWSR